ncbi:MAG: nucleotidyltransferase family protein [Maricaulaceae bacterium]
MLPQDCTLLIPASGLSVRFGDSDKLLANLNGKPLAQYVIDMSTEISFARRLAVVPPGHAKRANLFLKSGFDLVENPTPQTGQGESIALAMQDVHTSSVCIMLADMPFVPVDHVKRLLLNSEINMCIYSSIDDFLQPPAVFTGQAMNALRYLSGDKGMRGTSQNFQTRTISLETCFALDVDTPEDLRRAVKSGLTGQAPHDSEAS